MVMRCVETFYSFILYQVVKRCLNQVDWKTNSFKAFQENFCI